MHAVVFGKRGHLDTALAGHAGVPRALAAQRKPRFEKRAVGGKPFRPRQLTLQRSVFHAPPQVVRRSGSSDDSLGGSSSGFAPHPRNGSEHHCQTDPTRSRTPYGLAPFGKMPMGTVLRGPTPRIPQASSCQSSPHGYLRASVPRAAFSHSASLGRRAPRNAAYASAS